MTKIEAKHEMTRDQVAHYLREFAAQLDTSGVVGDAYSHAGRDEDTRVTFLVGDDSATINPPEQVNFEIEVESDSPIMGGETEYEVEFELTWRTTEDHEDGDSEELEIK